MVVVAVVLLVLAVALGVALVRTRAALDVARAESAAAAGARDEAEAARRRAESATATAEAERDGALEREKRARREAADVARRLEEAHRARADAEAESERLTSALSAARGGGDAEQLWALALAGVRRTWEVSVAPSPGLPSPLDGAADPLRAAIEVEVDAAREEAGAAIELEWSGDAVAPPAVALRALSIAQALIARLSKVSEDAVLRVSSGPDGVELQVEGTDGEGRSVVPDDVAAEHRVAPGRYVLGA